MGRFATGVAVVSLVRDDDTIAAMTINSLVSVSLDPMLVSWNLQNSSSQFSEFASAERFAFSILAEDQQALARRYAARGDSGHLRDDFELGAGSIPVIRGALATLACRSFAAHPAGDHTLILGQVEDLTFGSAGGRPLLFFGGRFRGLEHDH
jgi:flavin reductase (DIM6/NTAB) family NADH-FMN oxidoreductase RutF